MRTGQVEFGDYVASWNQVQSVPAIQGLRSSLISIDALGIQLIVYAFMDVNTEHHDYWY
jgi:hypothetical protein